MRTKALGVTSLGGSLLLAGVCDADFTGVTFVTHAVGPTTTTYRYYAHFDDPADQLLAVSGNSFQTLRFETNTVLVNDGGVYDGLKEEDFAQFPVSGAHDSWVTIGHSTFAGNDTEYSPGFLNTDGVNRVIEGSSWSDSNDGWYDGNVGTPATGTTILIAQFTVADGPCGEGGLVMFLGNVNWIDGGVGTPISSGFDTCCITPDPPAAPCCLPDRSCVELIQVDCIAQGGVWHPGLCSCADVNCLCPSDLDGDGDIGFPDLLVLLAAWGPCVGCPADLDGDGSVGFADLLVLLAVWGPCAA